MEEKGIVAYEEHVVDFYGDQIISIRDEDGVIWVPIIRPCENLGLHLETQRTKIQDDPSFSSTLKRLTASDGKSYEMVCLPADELPGWLFTISPNRIKDEDKRERLVLYRKECLRVLNDYWNIGLSINPRFISIDDESIKVLIQETANQTIRQMIETNYLPREQSQRVFEKDVSTILQAVSTLPGISDWAQQRIKGYIDDYLSVGAEIDLTKIIIGVTDLTPQLLARLHVGEKWCLDKILLYFPRAAKNKKELKVLCEEWDVPVNDYKFPINRVFQTQIFRDIHQFKRRVEDLVIFYNIPKEAITRNYNAVRKELETVFKNNTTHVTRKTYKDYINSYFWINKRDAFKAICNVCWDCNQLMATGLFVHHLTYERAGHEELSDVISLCKDCHDRRHPDKQ